MLLVRATLSIRNFIRIMETTMADVKHSCNVTTAYTSKKGFALPVNAFAEKSFALYTKGVNGLGVNGVG